MPKLSSGEALEVLRPPTERKRLIPYLSPENAHLKKPAVDDKVRKVSFEKDLPFSEDLLNQRVPVSLFSIAVQH
ncbi:hypothetical protein MHYP_G00287490 [Metynnis hypsauchen]